MIRIPTHRIPTHRGPTHPGEMLLEEFLQPMEITQRELASAINVPYQRINELVNKSAALHLAQRSGWRAFLMFQRTSG